MNDWALILGVSGVAGGAIARRLSNKPGMNIAGFHRGHWKEEAQRIEADVTAADRQALFFESEAGTAEAAVAGVENLRERIGPGRIRVFVHAIANASLGRLTGPDAVTPRQIEKTFTSMSHSFVHWVRELHAAEMFAPSARILGLTNPMPTTVVRNTPLISASKAALEIFVRHLAWELGPDGHRVNLLKYGGVLTPASKKTFETHVDDLERVTQRISPAGRMVTIDEVANFVSVLAGEEGAWFNGAVIDFSGGEFQSLYDALIYSER